MVLEPCYDISMLISIKHTDTCDHVISENFEIHIMFLQKYRKGFAKLD